MIPISFFNLLKILIVPSFESLSTIIISKIKSLHDKFFKISGIIILSFFSL